MIATHPEGPIPVFGRFFTREYAESLSYEERVREVAKSGALIDQLRDWHRRMAVALGIEPGGEERVLMGYREYARYRGVTLGAVQKAIAAGKITVEPNGMIDATKADRDWPRVPSLPPGLMRHGEYARHRGCCVGDVRRAILAGRITVEPNGWIDPVKADAAWPVEAVEALS